MTDPHQHLALLPVHPAKQHDQLQPHKRPQKDGHGTENLDDRLTVHAAQYTAGREGGG